MGYRIYNALVASVMKALNDGARNLLYLLINVIYRWGLGTAPALWADVHRATNLAGSYANGSSGVGATYTTSASYTSQDGVTLTVGMLVLLTGQSTALQNGLYKVTSIGSTTVLTRFAGWDASAEMIAGSLFYIRQGTTYGGAVWAYTGSSSPTVGVTSLTFAADSLLRSTGTNTVTGTADLSGGTLILPQSTSIAPTAEGSIGWDTDDNLLKVGDGASAKVMVDTDSAQTLSAKVLTAMGVGTPQALSGAGAVNVTTTVTLFTSTGAGQALTMADGTRAGQIKFIMHVVDGGSGVLTPTTKTNFTTLTLTAVYDWGAMIWDGSAWRPLAYGGTAAFA